MQSAALPVPTGTQPYDAVDVFGRDAMNDLRDRIAAGCLVQTGALCDAVIDRVVDVIEQVKAQGIETIRVLFTDQHGILRGKTIVASALASVFEAGIAAPSTLLLKDTSHRTVFPVWSENGEVAGDMRGAGDVLLIPDPNTFRVLPWSSTSAWILCDVADSDAARSMFCTRSILKQQIDRLAEREMGLVVGLEVEFQVYEVTDTRLDHAGATMPAQPPQTRNIAQGYQFLTEQRYDEMERLIDALRRHCQAMDLPIRSMEVEMGPSQIEFTFDPADPLTHADNMMMLRTMVKETCQRQRLHATFMCRPRLENAAANGWHLHQSLVETLSGRNLFMPQDAEVLTPHCAGWVAGLLEHAQESCLLSTPTVNGYKRYRPHQLAPNKVVWGRDNRGAMIRVLTKAGQSASRIENRLAEPAANPYLFFASQIIAGLDGIDRDLSAPAAVENPYDTDATPLPDSLLSAIAAFRGSDLYRTALGDSFVDYLSHIRQAEWDRYQSVVSEWEQQEYFGIY